MTGTQLKILIDFRREYATVFQGLIAKRNAPGLNYAVTYTLASKLVAIFLILTVSICCFLIDPGFILFFN